MLVSLTVELPEKNSHHIYIHIIYTILPEIIIRNNNHFGPRLGT
jgi:hypothetical protein